MSEDTKREQGGSDPGGGPHPRSPTGPCLASDAAEQTRFSALRQKASSLTAIAVVGVQYSCWFPKPQFPKGDAKGGQAAGRHDRLCYRKETLSLEMLIIHNGQ